jgi:hypothetical protein
VRTRLRRIADGRPFELPVVTSERTPSLVECWLFFRRSAASSGHLCEPS